MDLIIKIEKGFCVCRSKRPPKILFRNKKKLPHFFLPFQLLPDEKDGGNQEQNLLTVGNITLDLNGRNAFRSGTPVELTAKEFDLLELLAKNPNKVYSRENLLNLVWGYEYPGDVRTVDVHIRRLREKIETVPSDPKYVHTKWGIGYYFQG